MGCWCNGQLVVWAYIVILLLSSLWFIWNNSFCQIPACYTSTASNIRNLPITPGLLYLISSIVCINEAHLPTTLGLLLTDTLTTILRTAADRGWCGCGRRGGCCCCGSGSPSLLFLFFLAIFHFLPYIALFCAAIFVSIFWHLFTFFSTWTFCVARLPGMTFWFFLLDSKTTPLDSKAIPPSFCSASGFGFGFFFSFGFLFGFGFGFGLRFGFRLRFVLFIFFNNRF